MKYILDVENLKKKIAKCKTELLTDEAIWLHDLFTEVIDSLAVEVEEGAIDKVIREFDHDSAEMAAMNSDNEEWCKPRIEKSKKARAELAVLKEEREEMLGVLRAFVDGDEKMLMSLVSASLEEAKRILALEQARKGN